MTGSSASPSSTSGSGANTGASNPQNTEVPGSTDGTAPSIPDSGPLTSEHEGMVSLDDAVDDPTLPYRAQIVAVVDRIDRALPTLTGRELVSSDEMADLLLDLRLLLT
jgi:hypothetical protein